MPNSMVEEAEMAALDKLEIVTSPLPPSKPEKNGELSATEVKLQNLPSPPTMTEKWDWEEATPRENELEDKKLKKRDIDSDSLTSEATLKETKKE